LVDKVAFGEPLNEHLKLIVKGAKAFDLPVAYINKIKNNAKGVAH
jgi:hypothetical protein